MPKFLNVLVNLPSKPVSCLSSVSSTLCQCKLEQQSCLTGKDLSVVCSGYCPCAATAAVDASADAKRGKAHTRILIVPIHQLAVNVLMGP